MKKPIAITFILLSSILLGACGVFHSARSLAEPSMPFGAQSIEAPTFDEAVAEQPGVLPMEEVGGVQDLDLGSAVERLVIRDANLTIVVSDPTQTVEQISEMASSMGGFVVHSEVSESTYGQGDTVAKQGSITVRVPAERLDEALDRIKGGALEVRSENVSGQDVTEEYTDLQSRLRNLEQTEDQLREIMASASKTQDVLAVLDQLRRITEEIEVIKGRIQYLDQSARLSSISVQVLPDVAAQPLQIGRWQPQGTVKNAVEALIGAYQWFVDALIWIIIFVLPVAIVPIGILVLLALIVRGFIRRRRQSSKSGNEQ
jgi:hypothetical protein